MFRSFFPMPWLFFPSVAVWTIVSVLFWYILGPDVAALLGFEIDPGAEPVIGLGHFTTPAFLWFYTYYAAVTAVFSAFWFLFAPHRWQMWSIPGSSLIIFVTYFGVQVAVAINNWRLPFFDLMQETFSGNAKGVTAAEIYGYLWIFAQIAFVAVGVGVLTSFFASHYVFRWRNAMNDYYLENWKKLRGVEGASQRVQEDTMLFADIVQDLGISIVTALMTLIAFLPIMIALSEHVTELPLIGVIPYPLFYASLVFAVFGTGLLALVGIKLPGLEFRNQRVEAALRKELVYGEDSERRAEPPTMTELFNNVRRNYFRLYFHYLYFNIARNFYIQTDNIFVYVILVPTLVAGGLTLGLLQQILTAFGQVSDSFQLLIRAWPTIIKLMSIHKRLKAFESVLYDEPLSQLDTDFNEGKDTSY